MDMKQTPINSKQGMTKILEVMIAIVFTFTFLAVVLPQAREHAQHESEQGITLDSLLTDDQFRSCLSVENRTCVTEKIEWVLPAQYRFEYRFFTDVPQEVRVPDDADINVLSSPVFLTNESDPHGFSAYTFALYYWQ